MEIKENSMNNLENIPLAISYGKGNSPKNIGSEITNLYIQMEEIGDPMAVLSFLSVDLAHLTSF